MRSNDCNVTHVNIRNLIWTRVSSSDGCETFQYEKRHDDDDNHEDGDTEHDEVDDVHLGVVIVAGEGGGGNFTLEMGVGLTNTRVQAEILSGRTRVFVLARALTCVTVPGVTTCTVETLELLPGQVRQTLTRARV